MEYILLAMTAIAAVITFAIVGGACVWYASSHWYVQWVRKMVYVIFAVTLWVIVNI